MVTTLNYRILTPSAALVITSLTCMEGSSKGVNPVFLFLSQPYVGVPQRSLYIRPQHWLTIKKEEEEKRTQTCTILSKSTMLGSLQ